MTAEKQSALQTIEEKRDLVIEIADKVWELSLIHISCNFEIVCYNK